MRDAGPTARPDGVPGRRQRRRPSRGDDQQQGPGRVAGDRCPEAGTLGDQPEGDRHDEAHDLDHVDQRAGPPLAARRHPQRRGLHGQPLRVQRGGVDEAHQCDRPYRHEEDAEPGDGRHHRGHQQHGRRLAGLDVAEQHGEDRNAAGDEAGREQLDHRLGHAPLLLDVGQDRRQERLVERPRDERRDADPPHRRVAEDGHRRGAAACGRVVPVGLEPGRGEPAAGQRDRVAAGEGGRRHEDPAPFDAREPGGRHHQRGGQVTDDGAEVDPGQGALERALGAVGQGDLTALDQRGGTGPPDEPAERQRPDAVRARHHQQRHGGRHGPGHADPLAVGAVGADEQRVGGQPAQVGHRHHEPERAVGRTEVGVEALEVGGRQEAGELVDGADQQQRPRDRPDRSTRPEAQPAKHVRRQARWNVQINIDPRPSP